MSQELRARIDALLVEKPDADPDDETESDQETVDDDQQSIGLTDQEIEPDVDDEDETDDEETDQDESEEQEAQETDAPITAKGLAEKLAMSVEEIYKIEFPYGQNGESLSLGELKDVGVRARDIDSQSEQLEIDREAHTNDKMISRAEMQNIISLMPDIPQALVDQAQIQYRNVVNQERVLLMETMPAWSDPAVERTARDNILENLKTYGFTAVELKHMLDHRLVKLLDDFTRLKARAVLPKTVVKAATKRGKQKRTKAGSKQRSKNRERSNELRGKDTRGAINALLKDL